MFIFYDKQWKQPGTIEQYHMGTILLTVRRNNCKTSSPEAASSLFFEKIAYWIQLQIYRGNAQQGAYAPSIFAKQSYWSKADHCVFIHRDARSKK